MVSPLHHTRTAAFLAVPMVLAASALAQSAASTVLVTGQAPRSAAVAGFGDAPLARTPLQASSIGKEALADVGIAQLSGLTRLDASVSDAYNAEGYWSSLTMRGYTLDNRFNYRRDGLPINAETAIALENKERLDLLKGTSGIQAGTSAPGGLVDLVVKRPHGKPIRSLLLQAREAASVLAAVDISQRWGAEGAFGLRVNIAHERLDPPARNSRGQRTLGALALDWQLNPDSLLQAEIETSRQRQPSVAGFSMLGDTVPAAASIDTRINLNDQAWRQAVELNGDTASLRWQQRLGDDWRFSAHAMRQRLKNNDRTAFPFGVYDAATYGCSAWCDRFAPDGSFTYWQYVSDNERRDSSALQLALQGQVQTGALRHRVEAGVLATRYRGRFQDQVFDIAGPGRIDGSLQSPPSAGFQDANTNRDERSTEWFARDALQWGDVWQLWAGLRHTRLDRRSQRTSADSEGSLRATEDHRSATTPWLALAAQIAPKTLLYASWGRGLETDVAPNRARYTNAGESLALASRQMELGLKHGTEEVEAAITLFDIDRGQATDIGACNANASCRRVVDGSARHRGLEAQWTQQLGAWGWQASAMWLHAERRGSELPGVNGQRPTNVPRATLRLATEYRPNMAPGLALQANLLAEGDRVVLPYDPSARIPGWSRLDLAARWRHPWAGASLTWRLGLDNATDRRAWKESPYQFGHVYLYPQPARAWRLSVQAGF